MNYKKLGNTDLDVSTICLGTMTWGEQNTQDQGFEQMDFALDQGVNFWDTAEIYSIPPREETFGRTEEIIGNWFEKTKKRDKVILASKVCGPMREYVRGGGNQFGSKNITEIHGSRYKCRCIKCEKRFNRNSVDTLILPPTCECGGIIKFDTVLFGEPIPQAVLNKCIEVVSMSDFILVVGTSNLVNPSAKFPRYIKKNGGIIVEVNTNSTPISVISDVILRGSTSDSLPKLLDNISKKNRFEK